ncbi:MAG: ACT domain-containing protein [Ignisphaera sp.]|nr:ACT domain-containing protein [Ignisphaera sp.]MCX8167513.1 ACT domain-containing protein [Ignisphaera sp.]MDW8084624.1 ACT domain-containing protein [Ignisphaera sp.]
MSSRVGEELVVISVIGADKPGIVAGITAVLAKHNVNIVDIAQTVVRGIFSMIMVVDLSTGSISLSKLREELSIRGRELGVEVSVNHIDVFRALQRV